jgi:hypothetical protein
MRHGNLGGKRILFMAPRFFGYEQDIMDHLRAQGAQVDWLPDRPFDTPLMTAVTRFGNRAIIPAANRLYREMLHDFGAGFYDIIFIVNGQTLSREIMIQLRGDYPKARFVLYMWDSLGNRSGIVDKLDLFDELSSFDPHAADLYGMRLRHLFFGSGFELGPAEHFEFDLSFVGTAHTDRFSIVSKINAGLGSDYNSFWYLYLQAPWVYHAYRLTNPGFKNAKLSQFRFKPLEKSDVQSIFKSSKAILDIEHPRQTGLTMRTLETFGASKKLVTTNRSVKNADFYDPSNICVIDRTNPIVPRAFLEEPYHSPPKSMYDKYSLAGWVDEILGQG